MNPKPVCPHCLADPCNFTVMPLNIGKLQTIAVYCGNPDCRKVFGFSVIRIEPEQPAIIVPR